MTRQNDANFLKTVDFALESGKPLLIENIGESVHPALLDMLRDKGDPIKHRGAHHDAQAYIKFGKKTYKSHSTFMLFLTTTYERPQFPILIHNIVTMVNFAITLESLHLQLLAMVVGNEKKELEDKFAESSKEAYENSKALREIENAILELLLQSADSILKDDVLIRTLANSRLAEEAIASRLKTIESTSVSMDKARDIYSPSVKKAALMYFVVIELSQVAPMFKYSLTQFTRTFQKAINAANRQAGKTLQLLEKNLSHSQQQQEKKGISSAQGEVGAAQ